MTYTPPPAAPLASPHFTGTPTKNGSPILSQAESSSAFVPVPGRVALPGVSYIGTAEKISAWMVKGVNLGKIGQTSTTNFWTTGYDFAGVIQPAIDKAVLYGANTLRITGSLTAYKAGPATYKTRFSQVLSYAKTQGLKIIYVWVNANADTIASSNLAADEAMITDLITGWVADPMIYCWELANELLLGGHADNVTWATGFLAALRAADPTAKVMGGTAGSSTGLPTTEITAYESLGVDIHDIHIYASPDPTEPGGFHPNWLDLVRFYATKPLLIGEFGANVGSSSAYGLPVWLTAEAGARYIKALRRYFYGGVLGGCVWNLQDDGDGDHYGMFDSSGNPRAALAEWMQYPDRNPGIAKDFVDYRSVTILADNFARPDSATTVGTPPNGAAPVAQAGTWGISGKRLYLATPDAGGVNIITWDTRTADGEVEMEFTPGGSGYNIAVVARYADANNYWYLQMWNGSAVVACVIGGVTTPLLNATGHDVQNYGRARLTYYGNHLYAYLGDKLLWQDSGRSSLLTNTLVGVRLKSGTNADTGSKVTSVWAGLPKRKF